jgi:hypothetical protein
MVKNVRRRHAIAGVQRCRIAGAWICKHFRLVAGVAVRGGLALALVANRDALAAATVRIWARSFLLRYARGHPRHARYAATTARGAGPG